MTRVRCACGDPGCRELIDPAGGRKYAEGHRIRAHRRRHAWALTGSFWSGYRQLRRPDWPRRP